MDITIVCHNCRQRVVVGKAQAGQTVHCPRCKAPIVVKHESLYYHLLDGGKQSGPFTLSQLKSMWQAGKITVAARYSYDGMDGWRELLDIVPILERETQPRVAAVPGATQHRAEPRIAESPQSANPESFDRIVVWTIFLPIVGLIAGLVWLCNPRYRGAGAAMIVVAIVVSGIWGLILVSLCR